MANQKTPTKRDFWLKAYLDESNPGTFMNKTASAKAAKYRCKSEDSFAQVGCQNFRYFKDIIAKWCDDVGLTKARLQQKIIWLMEAKETKFHTLKGEVGEIDPSFRKLAVTSQTKYNPRGDEYTETEVLVSVDVDALNVQRQTTDMALKMQGLYAPEQHDHNVQGELKHSHEEALSRALLEKAKINSKKEGYDGGSG